MIKMFQPLFLHQGQRGSTLLFLFNNSLQKRKAIYEHFPDEHSDSKRHVKSSITPSSIFVSVHIIPNDSLSSVFLQATSYPDFNVVFISALFLMPNPPSYIGRHILSQLMKCNFPFICFMIQPKISDNFFSVSWSRNWNTIRIWDAEFQSGLGFHLSRR